LLESWIDKPDIPPIAPIGRQRSFKMADWKDPQQTRSAWGAAPQPQLNGADIGAVTMDQGLRKYMLSVRRSCGW
jgi:hypothetical protein